MQMLPGAPVAVISVHADPLAALGAGQNGGMNLAIRRLSETLAHRGVATDVFTRRTHPDQPFEEVIVPGARVVRFDVGPPEPRTPLALLPDVAACAAAIQRRALDEAARYRVVHGHHWVSGMVSRQLAVAWSAPWAQSFHTLARTKAAAGLLVEAGRDALEENVCRDANRLVAMSNSEAHELSTHYGADSARICVIQPGSDPVLPHHADELRSRLELGGHRVILFAGRLEPLKGTETLLDAIACLVSGTGYDDVIALIVGDDSTRGERERLEAIAESHGISGRVRFIGSVDHDDLADYYAVADVCVVPSRAETFGLVALEAEAAGVAVIAADVGGLREVVVNGETGFLVPANDVDGFCSRIAQVLDDDVLRGRLGTAGRARAAFFTWERAATRLESIYARLEAGDSVTPCADPV